VSLSCSTRRAVYVWLCPQRTWSILIGVTSRMYASLHVNFDRTSHKSTTDGMGPRHPNARIPNRARSKGFGRLSDHVSACPARRQCASSFAKYAENRCAFNLVISLQASRRQIFMSAFTQHPNLPLQSIDDLRTHWDWTKVKAHLVPSVAGRHDGWPQVILTGHPRLMIAVRHMGLRVDKGQKKELLLECQVGRVFLTVWMDLIRLSSRVRVSGRIRLIG